MKKSYDINVDCANCANLMESAVQKIDGVKSVVVNFMMQKIVIEFTEGANPEDVMGKVLQVCQKVDSDCEIEM